MAGLLGLPSPQIVQREIEGWSPDPSQYLGSGILKMNSDDFNEDPTGVSWDVLPVTQGMTKPSGLDAKHELIPHRGFGTKRSATAFWGEAMQLNHTDLLILRGTGPDYRRRKAADKVARMQKDLKTRGAVRIEWLIWQAITTGAIVIDDPKVKINVDYEIPNAHKWQVGVSWDNYASATPLQDLQDVDERFDGDGCQARYYIMNRKTAKHLSRNTAVQNLVKNSALVQQIGLKKMGPLALELAGIGGEIVIYDRGYVADGGTYTRFIPDNKVIVIGEGVDNLQSDPLGYFASTPDLRNGGYVNPRGGFWTVVKDRTQDEENPYYKITTGWNGLPVIFRPYWIQIITVIF